MSTPRQVETPPASLTEAQLVQIQSIVTRTVEQSVSEIASNAVQAAVQAMANVTPHGNASIPIAQHEIEDITVNVNPNTTSTNAGTDIKELISNSGPPHSLFT